MGAIGRRERLRAATNAQHTALDGLIAEANHFGSPEGYALWLQGSHGFHRDMTHALTASAPGSATGSATGSAPAISIPVKPLQVRMALLEHDLTDLGLTTEDAGPTMASAGKARVPSGMAEALGILYVTEGAALGSKLLLLRAQRLGFSETHGARYLAHAARDLASWRRVLALLEAFVGTPDDDTRMVAAAQRTFALAAAHMSQGQ